MVHGGRDLVSGKEFVVPDPRASRALVVCADERLLDELLELCAAAQLEAHVVTDPRGAPAAWFGAAVVLVSGETAAAAADLVERGVLPRRESVLLVTLDADDPGVWQRAVRLGAERVAVVPDAEGWLVERLAAARGPAPGPAVLVAVTGGRGGAGASTLAVALAVAAVQAGLRAMLVDADVLGGGLDVAVGAEQEPGLRWPGFGQLADDPGREDLPAVPALGELTVLSWERADVEEVSPAAMTSALDAGSATSGLVVIDLPRRLDAAARVALSRAAVTLLVVPAEVRACASAARCVAHLRPEASDLRLVVRGPGPARLPATAVQAALGLPLAGYLRSENAVTQALEHGEPPGRRSGALARAARALLAELLPAGSTWAA